MSLLRLPKVGAMVVAALVLQPLLAMHAWAAPFVDVLDTPARLSDRATQSPVFALARVDADHAVGVGPRGHILLSSDRGQTWVQQRSPVSSDLVAVQFPSPKLGWAVGHDGVALRSIDGGTTWERALDGRDLNKRLVPAYEKRFADGDTSVSRVLEDARRLGSEGANRPILAVFFRNEREGWLLGQFNMLLHTSDGGARWEPWLDRTDNPDNYSLHAIRAAGDDLYITGELGLVMKFDATTQRFKRLATPYKGSWFGAVGRPGLMVATGLRGNAWRLVDGGDSWQQMDTGSTTAAINGGTFLGDGRLALVTQAGQVLVGDATGDQLKPLPHIAGLFNGFDAVSMEPGWLLVGSNSGVHRIAVPAAPVK